MKAESATPIKTSVSRVFQHGDRSLIYRLQLTHRRTVAISVHPDRSIVVTAPVGSADRDIERLLRKRLGWITKQQQNFEDLPPPATARQWVGGETHRYLGGQYRLKIFEGKPSEVKLKGRFFEVTVPSPGNAASVRRVMDQWYRERAHYLLNHRVDQCLAASPVLRVTRPEIVIRSMTHRWGSCAPSGTILLNVDLVRLPLSAIDYVITHELCHLKVRHHGAQFWALMGRCLPAWKSVRYRLHRSEI